MNDTIIKLSRNTDRAPISSTSTQSVAFSHYNNISAQLPIDLNTGKLVAADIAAQAKQCLDNIKAIVESTDHLMDDVIKITVFLKDIADMTAVDAVYRTFFSDYLPTRSVVMVAEFPMDGALVQMDALLSNGEGTHPQAPCELVKVAKNTHNAPIDALSTQTVAFSHYNNVSAQLPIDPASGQLVAGGIAEQTAQCLTNIKAILASIAVGVDDIVKINIFITNLADSAAVDDVYSTFFPDTAIARTVNYVPARTVTMVSGLPMGALVQIEAVVSHGDGTPPQAVEDRHGIVIKANNTQQAPKHLLSTQTVAFSHYNHFSGQLPISPATGKLIDGDIKAQTKQCLENIKAIVESIDHKMDDIVKVTMQLKDISDIDTVNDIYSPFFDGELPARTVFGVSAIPMDALIQIDAVVSNAEGTLPVR
ncbi:RidA family protein [Psychrobacter sp. ANT_WB68]|uniref:RidA family protein n=1 Tax=Psychrobacter sp. ANT_WB68 TaxID=2597355 RepID=UPI0011F13286|nr:RidA family protein [Psychrobacter sp. ANT_WB68]KAA0915559.1 reactive intermediate/imine deaminase [Psychrobacter sp. ANT_WB68]